MNSIRAPAVAGRFYPADPIALRRAIEGYLASVPGQATSSAAPKALVAPHAGYVYSGPIAASAYAELQRSGHPYSRVVLLGPAHRVAFHGLAYSRASAFMTPLGPVPVAQEAYEALTDLPQVRPFEAPFDGEHCLEVQLPFLQVVLSDFQIVPLLVGQATTDEVAEVIGRLWGGDETLILISSDLTHYLDYEQARAIDAATSHAIETLRPEAIGEDQACGRYPLRGLLREAQRHALKARTLDLRNSGDTAGPRHQVVGYGAYAFYPTAAN